MNKIHVLVLFLLSPQVCVIQYTSRL